MNIAGLVGAILLLTAPAAAAPDLRVTWLDLPESARAPHLIVPLIADHPLDKGIPTDAIAINQLPGRGGASTTASTALHLWYDAQCVYIAFDCEEPDLSRVIVRAEPGQDQWPGDAVEVFLDPGTTRKSYYQFVTNSTGVRNDYGPGGDRNWNGEWRVVAQPTATGWRTIVAIPFSDFGVEQTPHGETWGLNLTRQRNFRNDQGRAVEELSTWAPIEGAFGSPDLFGTVTFGQTAPTPRRPPIRIQAALDRAVYRTDHPAAQAAVLVDLNGTTDARLNIAFLAETSETAIWTTTIDPIKQDRLAFDLPLENLSPGRYVVKVQAEAPNRRSSAVPTLPFELRTPATPAKNYGTVPLRQNLATTRDVPAWHVTTGVPMPDGALFDPAQVRVVDDKGQPIAAQITPTAWWSKDGAIKWLAVDLQTNLSAATPKQFQLEFGPSISAEHGPRPMRTQVDDEFIHVNTGAARFVIRRQGFNLIDEMWVGHTAMIKKQAGTGDERGAYMADEQGQRHWASNDPNSEVILEQAGSQAAIVRAQGAHVLDGKTLGRYVIRLYFHANTPYFRVQHTFIISEDTTVTRYSDIGVRMPFAGEHARFGIDPTGETLDLPVGEAGVSLLQTRWDAFMVESHGPTGEVHHRGERSGGWLGRLAAGDRPAAAVLVRDLWQNYPKELQADADALTVHAWPQHGKQVTSGEPTIEDAWRLWFVHEGDLLDFNLPASYQRDDLIKADRNYGDDGGGNLGMVGASRANAMGLGKTHDFIVAFGDAAQPRALAALAEPFEARVHMHPDPAWISHTRVAGLLHPVDEQRFPGREDAIREAFDYLVGITWDHHHAYGMFNYGDGFHLIHVRDPKLPVAYYRLWAGWHHARPRIPWLLYLRSGDSRYLRWAAANAQHVADVDTAHHTTPTFEKAPYSSRKIVGGLADYKGMVHWHAGGRVDYNSHIDFLLYDYYLTGNGRAKDVARSVGMAAVLHGIGHPSRHGGGVMSAMMDYYQATWDARAILPMQAGMQRMFSMPARTHRPPSIGWAPYLEPYLHLTGDDHARQFLLEFTDWLIADQNEPIDGGGRHYGDGRALTLAHELTGDRRYLLHAWAYYNRGPRLFQKEGSLRSGESDWYPYSYQTQQLLDVMAAMANLDPPVRDQEIPYHRHSAGPATPRFFLTEGDPEHELTLAFTEIADAPFIIGGRVRMLYRPVSYRLVGPDGDVIATGEHPPKRATHDHFRLDVPADQRTGDYQLTFRSSAPFVIWDANFSSLGTQRWRVPDTGDQAGLASHSNARWFFHVPSDCEQFRLHLLGSPDLRERSVAEVYDPDGHSVNHLSLESLEAGILTVTPTPSLRGKAWSIAIDSAIIRDVEGINRWFAAQPSGVKK